MECAKLIIQAGIKRVVFSELYRIHDGIDLLKKAGVECVHMEINK
jgi:dCMP deaminase